MINERRRASEYIIRLALELAVERESEAAGASPDVDKLQCTNGTPCSMENCDRKTIAKGLCSAHYQRAYYGRGSDKPLQSRWRVKGRLCLDCGQPTKNNGGWNRCQSHYQYRRRRVLKAALVDLFGGACGDCGGVFPVPVYDFHHVNGDKEILTGIGACAAIPKIAKELSKCVLLCSNCHRIEHFGNYQEIATSS